MFIGPKGVKNHKETDFGMEVEYEDGTSEVLSKLMYENVVSDKACDLSELRDKRIQPIVRVVLATLREWGVKVGELQYFSVLLNQSLNNNTDEAQKELWLKWIPALKSLDDIDLVAVDRVLRSKKAEIKPIISPYDKK